MTDNNRELETPDAPPPKPFHERFKTRPLFFEGNTITRIIEGAVDHPVTYELGENGVTFIEVYGEHGQMAMVPYLAVYKGEKCVFRASASLFSIFFKE